ncbi:MAG TPA: ABC transporter ATP-binding protein [Chloroflexota bacterium]|nr:ABC transporter ATP-binding protein [Chloroflexota bacterium]
MLVLADVHAYYGESHVLQGISLAVEQGQIVSLLGRNGVGKTTTLRTIMGLVPARTGQILYKGQSLVGLPPHRIARLGIQLVPEHRGIFPALTVRENLQVGAAHPSDPQRARHNAARVFAYFPVLRERLHQKGGSLSGGEQQQLTIARALMAGPELLLLDEPCEGLAPLVVRTLLQAIRDIRADGTTVLLVEQNVRAALQVADSHYVMDKGRIIGKFSAEALQADEELRTRFLGVSARL